MAECAIATGLDPVVYPAIHVFSCSGLQRPDGMAKTHLSRLLARVEGGEEIVLARRQARCHQAGALSPSAAKRQFGALRGIISVGPEFFGTGRGGGCRALGQRGAGPPSRDGTAARRRQDCLRPIRNSGADQVDIGA